MNKYLVLDFGGTELKYALVNDEFHIIKKNIVPAPTKNISEFLYVIDTICKEYKEFCGIAISSPGNIDDVTGMVYAGGAYPFLKGTNIINLVKSVKDTSISVINDANAAILAEMQNGHLSDVDNGVLITLGTGIGGAIMINRNIFKGSFNNSGEFSAIIMDISNADEQTSVWAAKNSTKTLLHDYNKSNNDGMIITQGYDFFKLVEQHNGKSLMVLQKFARNMAMAIFNLQTILDVEKFVIGGGISENIILIDKINEEVKNVFKQRAKFHINEPIVENCKYKNNANLYGALIHFFNINSIKAKE